MFQFRDLHAKVLIELSQPMKNGQSKPIRKNSQAQVSVVGAPPQSGSFTGSARLKG
jgi:hypothetical protein